MFLLDGKPISLDAPFQTEDGRQFPANFLRLATQEEREAIGITEGSDPPVFDQRYYWGYDSKNNLIPKQLEDESILDEDGNDTGSIQTGLKTQLIRQQKEIAGSLLASTDWYVTRKTETGADIPQDVLAYRQQVREVSNLRELEISEVTTVEELVVLLNSQPTIFDPETGETVPNTDSFITPWP